MIWRQRRNLARVSRPSYYRAWAERAPREAEPVLRDTIQQISIDSRQYEDGSAPVPRSFFPSFSLPGSHRV